MQSSTNGTRTGSSSALGPALEPALRNACEERLSPIRWFRSDWQRGGGSTGWATLATNTGSVDVVVKVPVGPTELRWTTALGSEAACKAHGEGPTPRVFAGGETLNGYDLGWLVMERLPGMPLAGKMNLPSLHDLIDAVARWHARAGNVCPAENPPEGPHWEQLIHRSRAVIKHGAIEEEKEWNHHLKAVQRALPGLARRWAHRPINTWCHGDLHPGNALRRAVTVSTDGAVRGSSASAVSVGATVLIDMALVHAGHWVEDALYLERIYWGRPAALMGLNPVTQLASLRAKAGVRDREDWAALADVRRLLMAACAPAMVEREGNPRYVQAALRWVQLLLPVLGR